MADSFAVTGQRVCMEVFKIGKSLQGCWVGVSRADGHNKGFFFLCFFFLSSKGHQSVLAVRHTAMDHTQRCVTSIITSDCGAGMSSFVGLQWRHNL